MTFIYRCLLQQNDSELFVKHTSYRISWFLFLEYIELINLFNAKVKWSNGKLYHIMLFYTYFFKNHILSLVPLFFNYEISIVFTIHTMVKTSRNLLFQKKMMPMKKKLNFKKVFLKYHYTTELSVDLIYTSARHCYHQQNLKANPEFWREKYKVRLFPVASSSAMKN